MWWSLLNSCCVSPSGVGSDPTMEAGQLGWVCCAERQWGKVWVRCYIKPMFVSSECCCLQKFDIFDSLWFTWVHPHFTTCTYHYIWETLFTAPLLFCKIANRFLCRFWSLRSPMRTFKKLIYQAFKTLCMIITMKVYFCVCGLISSAFAGIIFLPLTWPLMIWLKIWVWESASFVTAHCVARYLANQSPWATWRQQPSLTWRPQPGQRWLTPEGSERTTAAISGEATWTNTTRSGSLPRAAPWFWYIQLFHRCVFL